MEGIGQHRAERALCRWDDRGAVHGIAADRGELAQAGAFRSGRQAGSKGRFVRGSGDAWSRHGSRVQNSYAACAGFGESTTTDAIARDRAGSAENLADRVSWAIQRP